MNILSVIPQENNGPSSTVITASDKEGKAIRYTYSHTYELIHDPNRHYSWMGWNGGTLTEAILFIISL